MSAPSTPRVAALDALRGLAALSVVAFHYGFGAFDGARPLQRALAPVYEYGRFAVPLFYLLSGYIFFAAYAAAIGAGAVDGREFFWRRASRLYPLHLLTLLSTAALQGLALRATGAFFFSHFSDLQHFLLNLVFLQFGWFDAKVSFDTPSWSLSVEAGLYLAFFVFARRFGAALAPRLAAAALALALLAARTRLPMSGPLNPFFAEGLGCFFLGGALQATEGWRDAQRLAAGLALIALGAALFHVTGGRRETVPALFAGLVLVALAVPAFGRMSASGPLAWLGDISYSTYLWHFPVQVALVTVSATLWPLDFHAPMSLALYLGLTLGVATLSFRYFETPAREAIRRMRAGKRLSALPA